MPLAHRFRMFLRGNGWFYAEDVITRQQVSLRTKDRKEAQVLLSVKNEASESAMRNLSLARIYLQQTHPEHLSQTWGEVIDALIDRLKERASQKHWERVRDSQPFARLRATKVFYTEKTHFQRVLQHPLATPSTARWLRQLRNYAMDLGWLLHPVFPKSAWPKFPRRPRRAITSEEHRRLVAGESSAERRHYYQMLWVTGGAQTDVAHLHSDCIDESKRAICFQRLKLKWRNMGHSRVPIGEEVAALLAQLPAQGWFFPTIRLERPGERATKFKKLCLRLGIADITLHSYRYALAERVLSAGMPEKEAMAYLGHRSRGRHHAYAKNAPITPLPLCYYEQKKAQEILAMQQQAAKSALDKK